MGEQKDIFDQFFIDLYNEKDCLPDLSEIDEITTVGYYCLVGFAFQMLQAQLEFYNLNDDFIFRGAYQGWMQRLEDWLLEAADCLPVWGVRLVDFYYENDLKIITKEEK